MWSTLDPLPRYLCYIPFKITIFLYFGQKYKKKSVRPRGQSRRVRPIHIFKILKYSEFKKNHPDRMSMIPVISFENLTFRRFKDVAMERSVVLTSEDGLSSNHG